MKGAIRVRTAAALAACLACGPAAAEPPGATEPPPGLVTSGQERVRREDALRALEQRAGASAESRARLEGEVAGLRADRARLSAALVAAADRAREAEERARAVEARLDALLAREAGIRRSLDSRRSVIAEVLAALQRMGRRPPPAVLARPDDVLSAIRAAMLLGAALPGLREEAGRLAADLADLARLRTAIAADRAALDAEFAALAGERDRVAALVALRQARLALVLRDVGRERREGESLGREARTLRDLIDRTEREAPPPPAAEAPAEGESEARRLREQLAAASLRDPVRLAPRQPFGDQKGALLRPVVGRTLREFGAPDGQGGALRGVALGARPRAVVTASADGWVVFAGPFRSYGRLLIINAGGGYYLSLAGMDRVDVEAGQFVLAGEPVGRMGEVSAPSAALSVVEAEGPVLYVELRKDGGPIDPGPWWMKSQGERARG